MNSSDLTIIDALPVLSLINKFKQNNSDLIIPDNLIKICEENGYDTPVMTKNYGLIAINKFAFTWGILIDIDETGYNRRYCYNSISNAVLGFKSLIIMDEFNDKSQILFDPPDPFWIKRKGHPREITNPNNPELQKIN